MHEFLAGEPSQVTQAIERIKSSWHLEHVCHSEGAGHEIGRIGVGGVWEVGDNWVEVGFPSWWEPGEIEKNFTILQLALSPLYNILTALSFKQMAHCSKSTMIKVY